jgi:predicted nucleic acid-binding protein
MANFEYAVNSLIVLDKVKSSNCTAYDCEFIVLAEELNCKLITKDKEIIKNFPNVAIDLHDYINY